MDIENAIVKLGTLAVLGYREISQAESDDEMPEAFLGGYLASQLWDFFHLPVRVERYYTTMAKELGIEITATLEKEIGDLRADIAVYRGRQPRDIIELKILGEGKGAPYVVDDVRKAKKFADEANLNAYVGMMICETTSDDLDTRVRKLEEVLKRHVLVGEAQSVKGRWKWSFGCVTV